MKNKQRKCRHCGRNETPKRPLSASMLHRSCAIERAAAAAADAFDLGQEIGGKRSEPGQDTLDAGIARSVEYMTRSAKRGPWA